MESHEIIEGRIHRAGSKSIRNGPETEHPKGIRKRKAKQRRSCHGHTDSRHQSRTELFRQEIALKAGKNGSGGNNHGNDTGIGNRDGKFLIHRGPGRAQQRIRQPQADKRKINDGKKQGQHVVFPLWLCYNPESEDPSSFPDRLLTLRSSFLSRSKYIIKI